MKDRPPRLIAFGVALCGLLAACSPRPAPTPSVPENRETATATLTLNLSPVPVTSSTVSVPGVLEDTPPSSARNATRAQLLDSGRVLFQACAICHGGNGRGGRGPQVANSDYVQGDRTRLIRTVLEGVKEPIRVRGVRWKTGEMLGWGETWDDFKIAAVLTYIRATLNDSTVTACIPEDYETGTWASCTLVPRDSGEVAQDSVSVSEVAATRALRTR